MNMTRVNRIMKTCESHPAQWEGWTSTKHRVYVRYRWGVLTVSISEVPAGNAVRGPVVLQKKIGNEYNGSLSYPELIHHTQGFILWPEKEATW